MSFDSVTAKDTGSAELIISIAIPVHNGGENFRRCLSSLSQFVPAPATEIIVVADGDTDEDGCLAEEFGALVLRTPTAGGPARARNLGAQAATGDILFFMDADVAIGADTLSQIAIAFSNRPELAAIIGSYDNAPGATNFLSQYKNLLHHYTHQTACENGTTFWGACGAIRREIFLEMGGFDESYRHPSIEDIELGYRLKRAGYKIRLLKTLQVKHLKRWDVVSLVKADFFNRALPWTDLILRDRQLINDLNLTISSRVSVMLVYGLLISLVAALWVGAAKIIALGAALMLLWINAPVYRFFQRQRGLGFALGTIPWHWLYYFYSGLAFAIGASKHLLGMCSSKAASFPTALENDAIPKGS